jgi:hypothetical protein
MYLAGEGVSSDKSLAFLWMRRAAEQGDLEGQAALGDMYKKGSGVTRNPEQAAKWHKQAAHQGHAGAQFAFGQACATGSGVDRNVTQGLKWLILAIDAGYGAAADEALSVLKGNATPGEIAEGSKLAEAWKPGIEK